MLATATAAVAVATLGAAVLPRVLNDAEAGPAARCADGTTQLSVAAAPALAPVVDALGREHRDSLGGPGCVDVVVQPVDPRAQIQALVEGTVRPPDVWIPDSSLWLDRAAVEQVAHATNARSVASSPMVLALSAGTADSLRPETATRPTVGDLAAAASEGDFSVELSAEQLSPARVGAILALTSATTGEAEGRASLTALLRTAQLGAPTDEAGGSGTLPVPDDALGVPVSEHDVWSANSTTGQVSVVAVYTGEVSFDFPYAVLSDDPGTVRRAQGLYDVLTGPPGRTAVKSAGLRDRQGVGGVVLTGDRGVDGTTQVRPSPLSPASLEQAERALATATQDARLLAVIDVSGSMGYGLTGQDDGGPTRLAMATEAAAEGMALYPDSTEVSLWTFSQDIAGEVDHRELVPVARLGGPNETGVRGELAGTLASLDPIPSGGTALYATTLAAVRRLESRWDPTRINAVILLSDGENTDDEGPTLEQLVTELEAQARSDTPVPVITIAFGPEGDAASLAAISAASGGVAYRASTADEVRQIFLDAVGQRVCRPDCP